jgi:riboflavin synthase
MFTGIVQAVGRVVIAAPSGDGLRLTVATQGFDIDDVAIGDSIAVNGCCLTVVARTAAGAADPSLQFDVSAETVRCTSGLGEPGRVNLEKALRLADRLGGHLVSGHVDGVGTVTQFVPVGGGNSRDGTTATEATSWLLAIDVPADLARYVAAKGSIAVQGVSLTVNEVDGVNFTVNLIPHTLAVTTLGALHIGARVNIEIDLIARYVERMYTAGR